MTEPSNSKPWKLVRYRGEKESFADFKVDGRPHGAAIASNAVFSAYS